MNKPDFQMAIPAVTREYTPGACRTSRKLMRLPARRKMRPDSHELRAEEFRVPNQTHNETRFTWWNSRELLRTLSQDEKNSDVTSGRQNRLVYPKSIPNEAYFPCIGFVAIPLSTSYTTSGLTSFREIQRFPETPISSLEEYQFQQSNWRKAHCTPYRLEMRADFMSSTEEVSQLSTSSSRGVFPQEYVCERDTVFSVSSEMDPELPWLEGTTDFP